MAIVKSSVVNGNRSGQPYVRPRPALMRHLAPPKRAVIKPYYGYYDFDSVVFPFGPKDIQYQNYNAEYTQIPRPNKKAILFRQNPTLRTVTFSALLADRESGGAVIGNVENLITTLEALSSEGVPCKFVYGTKSLGFTVAITQLSYTVKYRDKNGNPTVIDVSIQLTEMPLFNQEIAQLRAVYRRPLVAPQTHNGDDIVEEPKDFQANVQFQQHLARLSQQSQDTLVAYAGINGMSLPI